MSKKNGGNRSSERRERNDLAKTCAFWGIVLAGVAMFIGFVISLLALLEITIGWAGTLRGIAAPGKLTPNPMVSHARIFMGIALSLESFMSSVAKGTTNP